MKSIYLIFTILGIASCASAQNNALHFDGNDDYVNCSNNSTLQINTGTVEAWIKTANAGAGYRGIIIKQDAYGLYLKDNQLITFYYNNIGDIPTGVYLNDNQWHHVAISFQSGVINGTNIYVDGNSVLTTTFSSTYDTQGSNFPLYLASGGPGYGQNFNGAMDEVRIWDVVRTQAQIQANMNSELNAQPGLLASYHFNQGTAGGNNAGINTLTDASGNNLTGSVLGLALNGSTSNWVAGNASLPVELLFFTAKNDGIANILQWQTASEWENRGFEVERSANGSDFVAIGFVAGRGTTQRAEYYTFTDEAVLTTSTVYYRL